MNWSNEQTAIFNWFANGKGNLVVEAYAGTGKTTTIKEAFNHAPEQRMLYAVFNKKNQVEAAEKITNSKVEVLTLHAVGFRFVKQLWRNANVDREAEIETERVDSLRNWSNEFADRAMLLKLVSFAKNQFIQPTAEELDELCEQREIQFESIDQSFGVQLCLKALEISKQPHPFGKISFNDMVWLPCAMGLVRPIYDLVAIDEAQDMSVPQLTMARSASKGRVVCVGDRNQTIYGFRGCHSDGLGMMRTTLRAAQLKLTVTYRCPKKVVEKAREVVPDYQAHESAPNGSVDHGTTDLAQPGDAILSRLNAPLIPLALGLIRKGVPARIEGRDVGKQLVAMSRSMKAKSVPNFFEKLAVWLEKQKARLQKSKNAEKKIEQAQDVYETLCAVAQDCKSVDEIERKISSLFEDTNANSRPAVVLSSVHKAKGLEWRKVYILSETFRRGKGREEDNIWYVAVTRSQHSLIFVGGAESAPSSVSRVPDVAAVTPPAPSDELIPLQQGSIINYAGNEYGCLWVNHSRAAFRRLAGGETVILKNSNHIVIRNLMGQELDKFLNGKIENLLVK